MLEIVIACTRNVQFVPTGIETDFDTFIALPEALSLTRCPACGGDHYWTISQTWICNTESSSRTLLPAEAKSTPPIGALTKRTRRQLHDWQPMVRGPRHVAAIAS